MNPNDDDDVLAFVERVASARRRRDAHTMMELLGRATGESPRMWGPTIIGYGQYHYSYASGREGDAPAAGFSPRTAATTVYLADGVDTYAAELPALGPVTTGVSCLYIKNLDDVDLGVLEDIVRRSHTRASADGFGRYTPDAGS